MQTRVRYLEGLPIEEPVLDETGKLAQTKLNQKVVTAYQQSGALPALELHETIEEYETFIRGHVKK